MRMSTIYEDSRRDTGIALLFGNEADGLNTEELSSTTDIVEIPTAPEQGSMNLSHAVAVGLSRIFEDCVEAGDWSDALGGKERLQLLGTDASALAQTK